MSALTSSDDNVIKAELCRLEGQRRLALIEGDRCALADLLTDDLVHVHSTGAVHGKSQLLDHATGLLQFVDVQRGELLVRVIAPDVAVMTGSMANVIRLREPPGEPATVSAFVTQVWLRSGDRWRVASFQATRAAEAHSDRG